MAQITETHFGARKRRRCIDDERDISMKEAAAEREQERGRPFSIQERRDFYRGWRLGKARYALEDIERWLRYAPVSEIDKLADELWEITRKHGLVMTDREFYETLDKGDD